MKHFLLLTLIMLSHATMATHATGIDYRHLTELKRTGQFAALLDETSRIIKNSNDLPVADLLRLNNHRVSGLLGCRRYKDCLELLNTTIEMRKPDSLRYHDLNAYLCMNDIFCALENTQLAENALTKAEETLRIVNTASPPDVYDNCYGRLHMARSVMLLTQGDREGALQEWRLTEKSHSVSAATRLAWYGIGGSIYQESGEPEKAEEYFTEALRQPCRNPNKTAVLLRYMALEIDRGDHLRALEHLDRYADTIGGTDSPAMRAMLLHARGDALYGVGRWKEAAECLSVAASLTDSLSKADNRLMNGLAAEKITPSDYSALQKKIESAEAAQHRTVVASMSAGLALLIALCTVLILKIRATRKARKAESKITQIETIREMEKSRLSDELKSRDNKLCHLSMAAAQTESAISAIQAEVSNRSTPIEERIRSIESALREMMSGAQLQETFRTQFDETNQQLYNRLSARHPDLTKSELNMAAYLLLNLNSKEIARITNRSVRTVDNIKYKLRKKLAITEPTAVYLRRIMSDDNART